MGSSLKGKLIFSERTSEREDNEERNKAGSILVWAWRRIIAAFKGFAERYMPKDLGSAQMNFYKEDDDE